MVALALPRRSEMAESAEGSGRTGTPSPLHRLLVVEDNRHITAMVADALRRLGGTSAAIEVEIAADGAEALARLSRPPLPSLVLTDLYMPVMDGFTLVERIRAEPRLASLPVVALSAGGGEARARAVELGVDFYLQKPVKAVELLDTVSALLQLPRR
jgi:CheY-like chemotaxis protein